MQNYNVDTSLLVRVNSPLIAAMVPSQDTTPDQLTVFYRPSALPFVRHSPLPVASNSQTNAAINTAIKKAL